LAVSFLFTFLSSLANSLNESAKVNGPNGSYSNGATNGAIEHSPEKQLKFDSNDLPIRSRQEMVLTDEYKPVGKPIKKAGAEIQASGIQSYFQYTNKHVHKIIMTFFFSILRKETI
jgi:indole-3-acetaldehyde oxidase